ncbi:hypothetical protein PCS_03583 [Desulfocurvibacter africanus PCS]|uniref:Uncharacterized protein n=1 Tax=Desulfocurvibacter africanus PCS TaxID=1262666 RepID=M5PZD1_DESAF|nr:hypothetical protein PCS_03583 [Desulfocurvibacter africanus PCS]
MKQIIWRVFRLGFAAITPEMTMGSATAWESLTGDLRDEQTAGGGDS